MSKALEYTTNIVSSAVADPDFTLCKDSGVLVSGFFEMIYKKIKELEDAESSSFEPVQTR